MIILKILLIIVLVISQSFSQKAHLLYTANINAALENCNCGSNPLGGIDRIKTFVNQFRHENPNTIFIDGGDFFNSYSFENLNYTMLEVIPLLKYNVMAPGVHIFFEKRYFVENYLKQFHNKVICSNSNLQINKSKKLKLGPFNIKFYSYISPKTFRYTARPDWLYLDSDMDLIKRTENEISVLIYHGFLEDAQEFIKVQDNVDLVLLSNDQQEGKWQIGNTIIVGGGHDAESVAIIEIKKKNNILKFIVNYKNMNNSVVSDDSILNLIKDFRIRANTEN